MILVIICGQPAAGKSTAARLLAEKFAARGQQPIEIIDEPSLHLERNSSYSDLVNEKNTRGAIRSAMDRALTGKAGVVILDSLNFIKGFRYELWCIARAAGARYCMVHVDTDISTCKQWNTARPQEEQYSEAVFDDLAGRFERPDQRQRWDAPLFTLRPAGDPDEDSATVDSILAYCCNDQETVQGVAVPKDLKPTIATSKPLTLGTNLLHDLDAAVQEVVDKVMEAQDAAAGGAAGIVRMPMPSETSPSGAQVALPVLQFSQPISLAELRRHKRAFLKLATKVTFSRLNDAAAARRMFVDYLIDNVPGCSRPHKGYGS